MEVSGTAAIRRRQDAGRREPDVPTRRDHRHNGGHDCDAQKMAIADPTAPGEIGPPVVGPLAVGGCRIAGDLSVLRSRYSRPTYIISRSHCHPPPRPASVAHWSSCGSTSPGHDKFPADPGPPAQRHVKRSPSALVARLLEPDAGIAEIEALVCRPASWATSADLVDIRDSRRRTPSTIGNRWWVHPFEATSIPGLTWA